jgi:hypothetical protein
MRLVRLPDDKAYEWSGIKSVAQGHNVGTTGTGCEEDRYIPIMSLLAFSFSCGRTATKLLLQKLAYLVGKILFVSQP